MATDELDPARAYDLWAPSYDTDPNPMIALSSTILQHLTPLPPSALEMGCGTGRNLLALHSRGTEELAGVDISQQMLAVAQRRLPQAQLWRQDIREPLPLPPKSVDLVLVTLVLEHIHDPAPVFQEAARLLAPQGRLLVLELHPAALEAGSRARFETADGQRFFTAAWPHHADELDDCATTAGFAAGELKDVYPDPELERRFPSRREVGTPWLLQGLWKHR